MRDGEVGIEQNGLVGPLHRARIWVRTRVEPTVGIAGRLGESSGCKCVGAGWIESHRLVE